MTLEIVISEKISVSDLLGQIIRLLRGILSWLKPTDEEAQTPELEDEEDNKSPPKREQKSAKLSESQNPPDLGIEVSDETSAGESFGP